MVFANPDWLYALAIVPVLAALFAYGTKKRRKELVAFTGERFNERLAPGRSWRKNLLKSVLKLMGLALLIGALARPQFGSQLVKVEREGIDLVITLDTSLSMLAEDIKPNRLARAKQEVVDLIQGLEGDRVGLVAFAGEAFVLCPLTVDYDAALMFAQTADVDIVSKPGSALHRAIETSLDLFPESPKSDQVIILVTDGEGHSGEPVELARQAGEQNVRIYTIGIGNSRGELIPLRGTDGSVSGYKKDKSGETVLTRLDEKTLREVASASGGKYLPATREGLELKVLYREISGLRKSTIEGEFIERKQDRFIWFLLASFAFLWIETMISRRGSIAKHFRRRFLHTGVARIVPFMVLVVLPSTLNAKTIERSKVKAGNQYHGSGEYEKALSLYQQAVLDSNRSSPLVEGILYNEANSLHMLGRYEEALNHYNRSFTADSLNIGQLHYNRGNTLMELGKFGEAVESYLQSLQYLADDEDARHNLEMALRAQQQQEQEQQQQQNQNQNDENQEKQDQQQDGEQNPNQDEQQQQDQEQQEEQEDQQQPDSTQTEPQEPDSTMTQPQPQSIQLTKEDAMRILKLLEEQEKELQKAKRKAAFKRVSRTGKDW